MALPIEDYALIGDTHAAGLVGRDGSMDWLCLPRFDSGACFAALLGDERHGRWLLAPAGPARSRRRYRDRTLVLETEFDTPEGTVRVVDCMPPRGEAPDVLRLVEGVRGRVPMRMELVVRFDYGSIVPWVQRRDDALWMIAGPEAVWLRSDVPVHGEDLHTVADFSVAAGEHVAFGLNWRPSIDPPPERVDAHEAVARTEAWWRRWSEHCTYRGEWRDLVVRSLITLKALTYAPTGGIVAAPTTSLPEKLGGVRNWDYRYCWLRDATLTLATLLNAGYEGEARAWREWLLRAVAGDPAKLQIMYGPAGERRLPEFVAEWLPGYQGASPVRIGNAAVDQFQLDVYGEVLEALHLAREVGIPSTGNSWDLQRGLLDYLESNWQRPDEGIWEVRGPRRHFTYSKIMAWAAVDRAIKGVELHGLDGPAERWRALRAEIHDEVCREGYDAERRTFTQAYDSRSLDASLLLIPKVGFLPGDDERVRGTVEAIERELCPDGFVLRYDTSDPATADGLPPGEGAFLACSFWLVDALVRLGRREEARERFERLIGLCNDVGLVSEEYDPVTGRLVGNFPQAFSHLALVDAAVGLTAPDTPRPH
jgi:GH15 family glucan-1,4-alpha-glucosidase